MTRPCLGCGRLIARGRRCLACESAWQAKRNARPERAIYRGSWASTSRRVRMAVGACEVCGAENDLTLDHTTGLVACRRCHRPDRQGGVRNVA